ncbi:MAG TPA: nitrogen fixation protein NifZ [Thiobacillaceae bacterium]
MGDMVFAAQDLYNEALEETGESSIPGLASDALLAATGTRGVVVNVGHAKEMPNEEIYLVRFEMDAKGALAEPVGCLADELSADELRERQLKPASRIPAR